MLREVVLVEIVLTKDDHEIDWEYNNMLHRQWILDGKHLEFQCPQGGTIIGAWDI